MVTVNSARRLMLRRRARVLLITGWLLVLGPFPAALVVAMVLQALGAAASMTDDEWIGVFVAALALPALASVFVLAGGLLCRTVALEGRRAFLEMFERLPRLEWVFRYGTKLVAAGFALLFLALAVLLAGTGLEALLSGELLATADEPAVGEVVRGAVMSIVMGGFPVGLIGVLLGLLLIGALWLVYPVWLLVARSVPRAEVGPYLLFAASVLIVAGVVLVVVFGMAGVPQGQRMVRGLFTTAGALMLVVPSGAVLVWAWRAGFRPWGMTGKRRRSWAAVLLGCVPAVAGLVLLGWLAQALLNAWAP